jgi:topoisomerase IA-like protein
MSRYIWVFGFFAINGAVPNLPRAYYSLTVPPKPGWPKGETKGEIRIAPVKVNALESKDADVEDLLFVVSPAFADTGQAKEYVRNNSKAKVVYARAANAVLYELPEGRARKEAGRKTAAKKRTAKKSATKKSTTKKRVTKKSSTRKR